MEWCTAVDDPFGVNRARAPWVALAVAALIAVGLLASSAFATGAASTANLPALNKQVLAAINSFRTSHGLVALRESKSLDKAAFAHSLEMGQKGYFGHNSANGQAFWKRVGKYYPSKGYSYWSVGENLLWAQGAVNAATAMALWIKSPPHLKNLKTAKWRDLGVSAVTVANAPGYFGGKTVTIITTDFGVRTR